MRNFLIILVLILSACTKKEVTYSKEKLYAMAKQADSSTTFILPKSMNEGPNCADYAEGCISTHIVEIKGLQLIAVEFTSGEQAIFAAKKVNGYYTRNWLLDDVTNEPTLERFVVKSLEAKKP